MVKIGAHLRKLYSKIKTGVSLFWTTRYIARYYSHWPIFLLLIAWVYLHSLWFGWLRKTHSFYNRVRIGRWFNVIQGRRFWYQSKTHATSC